MPEPKYYQTVSEIGKPIIELLRVEIKSSCLETIRSLEILDTYHVWSFNLISAIKYLWRLGLKTPDIRSDLEKAIQYLRWEIDGCTHARSNHSDELALTACLELLRSIDNPKPRSRSPQLIKDPYFRVEIDQNGSSPKPAHSIWTAQHVCVSEGFALDDPIPSDPAQAIIENQLKSKHWSVLEFGFVVLHFQGFPHDAAMQMCRHQGKNSPLVQSMRYTGRRIVDCGNGCVDPEEVFYVMPAGTYPARNGTWTLTESDRQEILAEYQLSAVAYSRAISKGQPEEVARRLLAAGYRQNFAMAGTIRSVLHWLDQRTLADSQIEAQTLAYMALDELEKWEPGLFGWYRQHRTGKNLLAP